MIEITSLKQPETGAILMLHCAKCKTSTIVHNVYAAKPADGDYWYMEGFCLDFSAHSNTGIWWREDLWKRSEISRPAF